MRKFLLPILFLMVGVSFAGSLFTTDVPYESRALYSSRTKDTLTASDSQTIYTKFMPGVKSGCLYYLSNNEVTGTGADSMRVMIYSDEYDSRDSLLGRILVDSIKTSYIAPVKIPVNNGLPGAKHTIKALTVTGSGSQIITNGWNIIECKAAKP